MARSHIVVLFGAGTTCCGDGILPNPTPLGSEVFSAIRNWFPAFAKPEFEEYRKAFEDNFEVGFTKLLNHYPNAFTANPSELPAPNELMTRLCVYFAEFSLDGSRRDPYSRFLLRLRSACHRGSVTLATLNYDALLEFALDQIEIEPKVLKLHGGWNLWPAYSGGMRQGGRAALGRGYHCLTKRVRHLISGQELCNRLNRVYPDGTREGLYPVMAMYEPNKQAQIGWQYLRRIQWRFRESVLQADRIALIGVRPNPADIHIWNPILSSRASIFGTDYDGDVQRWVERESPQRQAVLITGTPFSDCAEAVADQLITE